MYLFHKELQTMMTWVKRTVVALMLFGFVASVPLTVGCQSRDDRNKAKPDFKHENIDPSNVKMGPLPGGAPEAPAQP